MSVNINIDKAALVDAVADDICARCPTGGGITDLDMLSILHLPHRFDAGLPAQQDWYYKYVGGWHFYKYTGTGYPGVWFRDYFPWVGQWPTDVRIEVGAIMQIRNIGTNMYAMFFERVRTEATQTYVGFKIYSGGGVELVAYPAGQTQTLGTIQMGDIIDLTMVLLYNQDIQKWQAHGTLQVYNWDTDEWTEIGRAAVDIDDPDVPFKYIALFEANASAFEVAAAVAIVKPHPIVPGTDPTAPSLLKQGILKKMREKGMIDPRTVTI